MNKLALIMGAAAATNSFGACPVDFPVVEDFDASHYTGRWYEVVRDTALWFERDSTCTTATYSPLPNGYIDVVNRADYWYYWYYMAFSIHGDAHCPVATEAKCIVDFFGSTGTRVNYNVLLTDYSTYTVIYACTPLTKYGKNEDFWILSRETTLPADTLASIEAQVAAIIPHYNLAKNTEVSPQPADCQYEDKATEMHSMEESANMFLH